MNNQRSARALLGFSFFLLVVGAAISDPIAGFSLSSLAALSGLGSIALGKKRLKLFGVLALVLSVGLAVASWPGAKSHHQKYSEHINKKYTQ